MPANPISDLSEINAVKIIKNKTYKLYHILRSADYINDISYLWELSGVDHSDMFIQASKDYNLGLTRDKPGNIIWYCSVYITDEKRKFLSFFLSVNNIHEESTICKLIDI
jgi:hypothetical protein